MNETTILEKRPKQNGQQETKKEGGAWKHVTLGGVTGILMGAGLLYGGQVAAKELNSEATPEEAQPAEDGLKVAATHEELSFGDAFEVARAEVGPGGVFYWHGGIYNTYTAAEWNGMTPEQKQEFAQQVQPEIDAHHVSTPTDAHPEVASQPTGAEDVQVVDHPEDTSTSDADVHIVGRGEIDGHEAVALDVDNDGDADVAIIDINDNEMVDNDDVVMDTHGNVARVGDLTNDTDPNQMTAMENPDVAPDMPDYMNDANIDDMNSFA
jgi:hypothetical protein